MHTLSSSRQQLRTHGDARSSTGGGMLMLTEVRDGDFDVCELSLDYLRRRYGGRGARRSA